MLIKNNYLTFIIVFFLFLHLGTLKAISEVNFNFNVTEIEIDSKSEKIIGKKRGILESLMLGIKLKLMSLFMIRLVIFWN